MVVDHKPTALAIVVFGHVSLDQSMVNPLSYFSFQPVLHDWFNIGHGMYYPVFEMVISEREVHVVAAAGLLLLSEWSFTICLMAHAS